MPATKTAEATEIKFAPPSAEALPAVVDSGQAPALLPEAATLFQIIERAARDPAVDIDKMERLIAMHERVQAKSAQLEYDNAMSAAQEDMKAIRADASNPQTRSNYATYAALDHAIRPIYTRHGFALSFNTGDAPKADEVRMLCTVSHRGGHRQDYKLDMPADGKGAKGGDVMTKTHATGAAASYGQRYLFKLIFNLAVGDVDDDGNGASADGDIEALAPKNAPRDADGKLLSTYNVNKAQRAKAFADDLIQTLNHANRDDARQIWTDNWKAPKGSRVSPLAWLELHAPDQFARVQTAHENAVA